MSTVHTAVTLPMQNPPAHKVPVQTLPCYVILVHGVNDVGEAYPPQEEGLCRGLCDRLGRNNDLQPYEYKVPKPDRSDAVVPVPERVYFHRVAGTASHSPVIPFYWGFREENARIEKGAKHGEWLDPFGNRLDKDGVKGGGPFVNACNCLPHMWAGGWKPDADTTMADKAGSTPTHRLNHRAPDRRYFVLAALRLAMVIRILRKRHPQVAINVVAHSMGCLVSLLAQVFLMDEGQPPADTLVLNDPPYSLVENGMDEGLFRGENQTSRARIETLKKLVKAFHEKRLQTPAWVEIHQSSDGDLAWKLWATGQKKHPDSSRALGYAERDNRGKIYLYFNSHDRTVALLNTQGIGWTGVPDTYTVEWTEVVPAFDRRNIQQIPRTASWPTLFQDLQASGFRQRLFMRQIRNGKLYQVGIPPHRVDLREAGDDYQWGWADGLARKKLKHGTLRTINGESLSPPASFVPGPEVLPVSPIDAAVALTDGGAHYRWFTMDDPRPPEKRKPIWADIDKRAGPDQVEISRLKDLLMEAWNRDVPPLSEAERKARDINQVADAQTHGKLMVLRSETPSETKQHWQTEEMDENSYHSSIVSNPTHSRYVTAYDLAVAKAVAFTEKERTFYDYVCEIADWRIKVDKPENPKLKPRAETKLKILMKSGFYEKEDPKNKELIEATAQYYEKGERPYQVDQTKTPNKLASYIHYETTGKRSPVT